MKDCMRLYDTTKIFIIKVIYKFKSTKNSSCGIKFIKNVCFIFIIIHAFSGFEC